MSDWEHDELVQDLLRNRWDSGRIAAHEVSLSPWGGRGGGGQADVLAVRPSWTKPAPTVYEVKATRSDLLSDLRKEKWKRYLPWCNRLYFAAPSTVAEKADAPKGVGLFLRNENGWYSVKAPRLHYRDEDEADYLNAVAMAILLSLKPSPWQYPHPDRVERLRRIREGRKSAKELGKEVAEAFHEARRKADWKERAQKAKVTLKEAINSYRGSDRPLIFGLQNVAERAAEIIQDTPGWAYNRTCELVQEAMPLDQAFDPASLPAHVGEIIRERDHLRDRVEELEDG